MSDTQYLKLFFDEKEIPWTTWEIQGAHGEVHFIDSDVVIEAIHGTQGEERRKICNILRRLDFANRPILPFLRGLAGALVGEVQS